MVTTELPAPPVPPTGRARELLAFLAGYSRETGTAPTFNEMSEAMGHQSRSGIHRLLVQLEERGWIERLRYRHRAIRVLHPYPAEAPARRIKSIIRMRMVNAGPGAPQVLGWVKHYAAD